jgi:surface protein
VTDMSFMFDNAVSFNGDIGTWHTSKVTEMSNMFYGDGAFDQNLGRWDVSSVTNMANMLDWTSLSITNYDATLIGWAGQTVQHNVALGAAGRNYSSAGEVARNFLMDVEGSNWVIVQ